MLPILAGNNTFKVNIKDTGHKIDTSTGHLLAKILGISLDTSAAQKIKLSIKDFFSNVTKSGISYVFGQYVEYFISAV